MRVLDQVNGAMGAGTLRLVAEGFVHRWAMRFEKKLPVAPRDGRKCRWRGHGSLRA